MIRHLSLITVLCLLGLACGSPATNTIVENQNSAGPATLGGGKVDATPTPVSTEAAKVACYEVKTGEKALLKSQTFPIDFEPFKGSCFVTSHEAEFKDPPLDSEIAIYKAGKLEYQFPQQFNGVKSGCWVEGVAFQDVNFDKTTDVIVVGKCSAKTDSYNENVAYLNNGRTFVTREDSNYLLQDLKTIREIVDYIKTHPQPFSLTADAANSNSKS